MRHNAPIGTDLERFALSRRGLAPLEGEPLPPYLDEHFKRLDQLCTTDNPSGYIPMCIAENRLVWDLIAPKARAPRAVPAEAFGYDHMIGSVSFRERLATFAAQTFLGRTFETDQIAVLGGGGSVLELVFHALADAGDAVLVPTPSYAGFWLDLETRDQLHIHPVHTHSRNDFRLTIDALDRALASSERPVKALLLTTPNNPLGTVYSADELSELIDWALLHDLHVVVDEIYALSIHGSREFKSVASLRPTLGNRIHIVWAFSKDFAASGLRCGVLFTENQGLIDSVASLAYWAACSGDSQYFLGELIADDQWVASYLRGMRQRLRHAYQTVVARLEHHKIPYQSADAGFFLLIDLRSFLTEESWAAEDRLWRRILSEANVNLTPGCSLHNHEPGFMRLCFASVESDLLEIGVDRLALVLAAQGTRIGTVQKP